MTDAALFLSRSLSTADTRSVIGNSGDTIMLRSGGYAGAGLHEVLMKSGDHKSLLNGAGLLTDTSSATYVMQEFGLGARGDGTLALAIDVFAHGMFPDGVSDTDATTVRNYITALRPNILP